MIIISEQKRFVNLYVIIVTGILALFVSLMTTQCQWHYPVHSPENIDSTKIEFVSDGTEAMDIAITYCGGFPIIDFLYIDSICINIDGSINCIYDSLVVEAALGKYIYTLLFTLFVSKELPIYAYYEYDEKQLKVDMDLGWLTINNFACGQCNKETFYIYDVYRKGAWFTDDGYVYQYSKQFKALIQYCYFIIARHIGGEYYDDYIRELNECRNDSTKEVFIPDSI